MENTNRTHISISKDTKERLKKLKKRQEDSYNTVIRSLIVFWEEGHVEEGA